MIRLAILAVVVLSFASLAGAIAAERPNFVVIIGDDLSPDDLGCYGNNGIRTPNIDRLASAGLRFDNAFLTCSSCSPSRSSIMTGRYPHQTGAAELHQPLPAEQIIFPQLLNAMGYFTGVAGKWHLGPNARKGFDKILGGKESGAEEWLTLLRDRPKDKPFFLWLASIDPHRDYKRGTLDPPHKAADTKVPPFLPDNEATRNDLAMYYDEIGRLDKNVGAVLAELEKQKVAEETIVVFLADNGRPFPRCKTTVYDSGIRTPLLIRWPGKIKAGETRQQLVSSIDLSSTIFDLAGIKPGPSFLSESFAKVLTDPQAKGRDAIFAEHNWHDYQAHERAVRTDRFLYIRNSFPELTCSPPADAVRSPTYQKMIELEAAGKLAVEQRGCFVAPRTKEELYDVVSDPHQLKNLAGDAAHEKALADLRQRLDRWIEATKDQVPAKPTPDKYDRKTGKAPSP